MRSSWKSPRSSLRLGATPYRAKEAGPARPAANRSSIPSAFQQPAYRFAGPPGGPAIGLAGAAPCNRKRPSQASRPAHRPRAGASEARPGLPPEKDGRVQLVWGPSKFQCQLPRWSRAVEPGMESRTPSRRIVCPGIPLTAGLQAQPRARGWPRPSRSFVQVERCASRRGQVAWRRGFSLSGGRHGIGADHPNAVFLGIRGGSRFHAAIVCHVEFCELEGFAEQAAAP